MSSAGQLPWRHKIGHPDLFSKPSVNDRYLVRKRKRSGKIKVVICCLVMKLLSSTGQMCGSRSSPPVSLLLSTTWAAHLSSSTSPLSTVLSTVQCGPESPFSCLTMCHLGMAYRLPKWSLQWSLWDIALKECNRIKILRYDNITIWSPRYDIYCKKNTKKKTWGEKIRILYILKLNSSI